MVAMWLSLTFLPFKEGGRQVRDLSALSIYIPPPSVFISTTYLFPFDLKKELILLLPFHPHTLFGYLKPVPDYLPLFLRVCSYIQAFPSLRGKTNLSSFLFYSHYLFLVPLLGKALGERSR